MTNSTDAGVPSEIRDARLVYGAILVGEQLSLVECIDEDTFDENESETALYTAFNNVGANLVPVVARTENDPDEGLPVTATPYQDDSFETPRLTTFERVADVVPDARAYYLLLNTVSGDWRRIQHTDPDQFTDDEPLSVPETGRYVVASALIADASDRFAEFPEGVDAADIELIDWSG